MNTITVEKDRLRATLLANRTTHNADFEIAWEKFVERVRHNFEQRLASLKDIKPGDHVDLYINLVVPENHDEDYERAIAMLDWETGHSVKLTEGEFRQYVQDKWGWTAAFTSSNRLYTGYDSPSSLSLPTTPNVRSGQRP